MKKHLTHIIDKEAVKVFKNAHELEGERDDRNHPA
jgi:hypothetical protein